MSFSKRVADVVLSSAGLVFLAPLLIAVMLIVLLVDGRPVFFVQRRIGLNGSSFKLLKMRTMTPASDKLASGITVGNDSRITNLGAWLRRTKVDEFPQLINVLRGEMSLVGPRPEVPKFAALYTKQQQAVLKLVPGITDPASLKYIDEQALLAEQEDPMAFYVSNVMPDKIKINLAYAEQASVWTDCRLVVQTLLKIIR